MRPSVTLKMRFFGARPSRGGAAKMNERESRARRCTREKNFFFAANRREMLKKCFFQIAVPLRVRGKKICVLGDQSRRGAAHALPSSPAWPLALRSTCPRLHSCLARIGALSNQPSSPNLYPRLQAGPNLIQPLFPLYVPITCAANMCTNVCRPGLGISEFRRAD